MYDNRDRFDHTIHKGHHWSVATDHCSVRQGKVLGICDGAASSVLIPWQAGNLLLPSLRKAAALEGRVMFQPLASQYKTHEAGFHPDTGFLIPVEWTATEFWIKSIIKAFGLIKELLIRQKRCLCPYVA